MIRPLRLIFVLLIALGGCQSVPETAPEEPTGPELKHIHVHGTDIVYMVQGRGIPIVFIHGASYGANIALDVALARPDLVFGLALEPSARIINGPSTRRYYALSGEALSRCISSSQRVVIPNATYGIAEQAPSAFNAAVVKFLSTN